MVSVVKAMRKALVVGVLLCIHTGCLSNRHIRQASSISTPDAQNLPRLLSSPHRYVRLTTLQQLNSIPTSKLILPPKEHQQALLDLLDDEGEWCPIRAQAALTIGKLHIPNGTTGILEALNSCDDESRYWMLQGLKYLAKTDPIALGAVQSLSNDPDIFIRTDALRWLVDK